MRRYYQRTPLGIYALAGNGVALQALCASRDPVIVLPLRNWLEAAIAGNSKARCATNDWTEPLAAIAAVEARAFRQLFEIAIRGQMGTGRTSKHRATTPS